MRLFLGVASGVGRFQRSRGGQRRKMYKEVGELKKAMQAFRSRVVA